MNKQDETLRHGRRPADEPPIYEEMRRVLPRNGYETGTVSNGQLPILQNGCTLCVVTPTGNVFKRTGDVDAPDAYAETAAIAKTVVEYMQALEHAPFIKAVGLDSADSYKALCHMNGVVLAGKETKYGCQFATWRCNHEMTDLYAGDYFDNYVAAKEDFAVRAGLIPSERLFNDEQLASIAEAVEYRIENDSELTDRQYEQLTDIRRQIYDAIPDVTLDNQEQRGLTL